MPSSSVEAWYLKVDDAAMAALPPRLDLAVNATETYVTPLIPSLEGEEMWLVCSFCPATSAGYANVHGVPRLLYPPRVTQRIHYPSGRFEWLEPAPSSYSGPPLPVTEHGVKYLGVLTRNEHLQPDELVNALEKHFPLVCRVVEQRWLLTAYPTTEEERATARELQACVRALYDAPLLPYYRHYGHHFLAWMERAAQ